MEAFNWLKRLRSDTSGNVLAIGAAAMPLMIAAAAIGVDTVQISLSRSQLQRSADSAALAGAFALAQGRNVDRAATRSIGLNDTIAPASTDIQSAPEAGAFTGDATAVRVVLTAPRTVPFMSFFGVATPTLTVEATARVVTPGPFCMLSLYEGTDAGVDVGGNANVTLGCGIASNSRGASAIEASNNTTVTADPIMAVGGINLTSSFLGKPQVFPYSAKQLDPFADVPDPTTEMCADPAPVLTFENAPTASGTYCYSSINVKPGEKLTLPSDSTIIVNGGNVDFQGDVDGARTAIVMTGPGGAAGDLKINSKSVLKLTSPTSGTYEGILFYRDRRAANIEITINGGAASDIEGALYFPSSDIKFAGHADMKTACMQMVGQKLKFHGGSGITNVCGTGGGGGSFGGTIVRLVA